MDDLARHNLDPWLIGRDFNVISNEEEKLGVRPVSKLEVRDFNHYINVCNIVDLSFKEANLHGGMEAQINNASSKG